MGNGLTVKRESAMAYGARRVKLLIDDQEVASLNNGGIYTSTLSTGYHTIELKMGTKTVGVQQIAITNSADVTARFTLSSMGTAAINVTQITTGDPAESSWNPPQPASSGPSVYEAKAKNSGCLWGIIVAIIIFTLLWILLPSLQITFHLTPA